MIVRQAELKDAKEILEIVNSLYLDIPKFVWNDFDFVQNQINSKEYFVIENNGMLIGAMSLRQRTNKINIETLVVKKEFQRQGIGGALIEFAKQFTKEKGVTLLHAYSFPEYRIADFYKKKGFKMLDYTGYYKGRPYDCFELAV